MPVISGNTEELSASVKSLKEKKGGRSAFFKITAVYGHIDENGAFVRNPALDT